MSLNTKINLNEDETNHLINFFKIDDWKSNDWKHIKKELKDDKYVLTFILSKTVKDEMSLKVDIFNRRTLVLKSLNLRTMRKFIEIFEIYNFSTSKNDYYISIKPYPVKNKLLYQTYINGLSNSLKNDSATYMKHFKLKQKECNDTEQLWNIVYAILSNFEYYKNNENFKDDLCFIRDKLSYYGYNEEITLNEFLTIPKAEYLNNRGFIKQTTGLLLFFINNILNGNLIKKDELDKLYNILSELSTIYYEFLY